MHQKLTYILFVCAIGALFIHPSSARINTSIKEYGSNVVLPPSHFGDASLVEVKYLHKRGAKAESPKPTTKEVIAKTPKQAPAWLQKLVPQKSFLFTKVEHLFGVSVPLTLAGLAILILLHPTIGFYIATVGFALITVTTVLYVGKLLHNLLDLLKNWFKGHKAGTKPVKTAAKSEGGCCDGKKAGGVKINDVSTSGIKDGEDAEIEDEIDGNDDRSAEAHDASPQGFFSEFGSGIASLGHKIGIPHTERQPSVKIETTRIGSVAAGGPISPPTSPPPIASS